MSRFFFSVLYRSAFFIPYLYFFIFIFFILYFFSFIFSFLLFFFLLFFIFFFVLFAGKTSLSAKLWGQRISISKYPWIFVCRCFCLSFSFSPSWTVLYVFKLYAARTPPLKIKNDGFFCNIKRARLDYNKSWSRRVLWGVCNFEQGKKQAYFVCQPDDGG